MMDDIQVNTTIEKKINHLCEKQQKLLLPPVRELFFIIYLYRFVALHLKKNDIWNISIEHTITTNETLMKCQ